MTKTIISSGHKALVAAMAEARKAAGMTQADLAKRLRCQQSLIARVESGQRRIDAIDMVRWGRAIGKEPRDFLQVVERATPADP